jgi:hypothetical protein
LAEPIIVQRQDKLPVLVRMRIWRSGHASPKRTRRAAFAGRVTVEKQIADLDRKVMQLARNNVQVRISLEAFSHPDAREWLKWIGQPTRSSAAPFQRPGSPVPTAMAGLLPT